LRPNSKQVKVFQSIEEVDVSEAIVATIGTFDGVHQGHREVLSHLMKRAKERNAKSLLITFDPHPRIVLNKGAINLRLINNPIEKIEILKEVGIDYLLVLPFTFEFSKTSARDFIQHYLINKLHVKAMVIGYDHQFGRMDAEAVNIDELLKSFNIDVERVPEMDVKNLAVSSTKVRQAISEGNFELANVLLGYKYAFCGTVIHGNKIGRTIGFPTANLMLDYKLKLVPADGVYVVEVYFEDKEYQGMLNIGYKPTINIGEKSIEIHILNFDRMIYGSRISVRVLKKIRDEIKFASIIELKQQLEKDKIEVEKFFNSYLKANR